MELAKLVLEYLKVLIWPATTLSLCMIFRSEIRSVVSKIRKAILPGGVAVDFGQEIEEAKRLSREIPLLNPPDPRSSHIIPLTEANARMIQLGLKPTPSGLEMDYFRRLAVSDPNLALAGLRIELELLARNLAKGFGVEVGEHDSLGRLLLQLRRAGAITPDQMELAQRVVSLCNRAIHGQPVSPSDTEEIVNAAEGLVKQYLAWLSWGFGDGWAPGRGGATSLSDTR